MNFSKKQLIAITIIAFNMQSAVQANQPARVGLFSWISQKVSQFQPRAWIAQKQKSANTLLSRKFNFGFWPKALASTAPCPDAKPSTIKRKLSESDERELNSSRFYIARRIDENDIDFETLLRAQKIIARIEKGNYDVSSLNQNLIKQVKLLINASVQKKGFDIAAESDKEEALQRLVVQQKATENMHRLKKDLDSENGIFTRKPLRENSVANFVYATNFFNESCRNIMLYKEANQTDLTNKIKKEEWAACSDLKDTLKAHAQQFGWE